MDDNLNKDLGLIIKALKAVLLVANSDPVIQPFEKEDARLHYERGYEDAMGKVLTAAYDGIADVGVLQ